MTVSNRYHMRGTCMIIAVMNNKGGTGKTTTTVNLSAALAMAGHTVLLVDLDSQASASLSLGVEYHHLNPSVADVLFDGTPAERVIRHSNISQLDMITGSMALAHADLVLADMPGREVALLKCLKPVVGKYDFILLDCPPSISLLTVNALSASDGIIIPMTAEYLALEGMISLMDALEQLKTGMNLKPLLLGIVFTMVNSSLKTSRQVMELVHSHYGADVFKTEIRRTVTVSEAPSYGKCIYEYAPQSQAATDFSGLAVEVLERCGMS